MRLANSPFPVVVVAKAAMLSYFSSMFEQTPVHANAGFVALKSRLERLGGEIILFKSVAANRLVRMQSLLKDLHQCGSEADRLRDIFIAECLTRKINKRNGTKFDTIKEDEKFIETTPIKTTFVLMKDIKVIYDLEVSFREMKAKYESLRESQVSDFAFLVSLEDSYRQTAQTLVLYEKHLKGRSY